MRSIVFLSPLSIILSIWQLRQGRLLYDIQIFAVKPTQFQNFHQGYSAGGVSSVHSLSSPK